MLDTRHNPRLKSHNVSKFAMITYSVTDHCFWQTRQSMLSFSVQIEHGGKFSLRNLIKTETFHNDQMSVTSVALHHLQYLSRSFFHERVCMCVRVRARARNYVRGATERTASYNGRDST